MSTLSMSNAISALPKIIGSLEHILRKAEQNAEERGIDMDVLLNSRLAPDMHPLYKQVLMVCDMAKMAPYRDVRTPNLWSSLARAARYHLRASFISHFLRYQTCIFI